MSELIKKFYSSFSNLNAEGMVSCYHDNVVFEDPAFGKLSGEKAKNMWRMLCESQKGKDFIVKVSTIEMKGEVVSADWEAIYVFSKTNRKVHNNIHATFVLSEGKIIKHVDEFNIRNWAGQAFGLKGLILGNTQFFKNKLNKQTNGLLEKFELRNKGKYS